jgi:signal transduction histidine kinase
MPYRTTRNVIAGLVVTFTDVTPLGEAKKAADEATAYAENIVNTVREPLLVLNPDLRVRSASDSFYKMFQATPEETLNRTVYELGNHQWDIPELRVLLGELLPRNRSMNDFQVTHNFASIGQKTMLLNARIIEQGAPLILLAIEDITDRKLSEAMLRDANADLKHFAFAASHDLQEPLRMVTSYTQLLAKQYKDKLGKDADTYIGYAVEGAQRMETLLKDLRNYWAVNEEKLDQPVRVDSNAVLKTALDFLAIPIRETGAVVNHDPLPPIMAEELPLALLFQNLISNALKYHRKGTPPKIRVSAQQKDHEWNFSVRDNGIGIEEEHLEKIFAPFKRLHGRNIPGSGIGLAICQKIVERYGGRIWVESEYGKGSTFHFTFPADKRAKE